MKDTNRVWRYLSAAVLSAALTANVSCSGDDLNGCPAAVVVIASPVAGATIDASLDVNEEEDGVQFDVVVRTERIAVGTPVSLSITDQSGTTVPVDGTADVGADGSVTFASVTLPTGRLTLTATVFGCDGQVNTDLSASVEVLVVGDVECQVSVRETALDDTFYAPLLVLNSQSDTDSEVAGFQGNVDVLTAPGYEVELLVLDGDLGTETVAGEATADESGNATFTVTLEEGRQAIRANCNASAGGQDAGSLSTAFLVDVTAPTCALVDLPGPVIPADDEDPGTPDIQVSLSGSVSGDDVEGQAAAFQVDSAVVAASAVDSDGATSGVATFASPGTFDVVLSSSDRAENPCTSETGSLEVITDGCSIAFVGPTPPVTADGDPATAGLQTTLEVDVAATCVGRTVTFSGCAAAGGDLTAEVGGDGRASVASTVCQVSPCEVKPGLECTASVVSPDNIETSADLLLEVDNQAPALTFLLTTPPVPCGGQVTTDVDVSAGTPGVQVTGALGVTGGDIASEGATLTNDVVSDQPLVFSSGFATFTLEPGLNVVDAQATDNVGNQSTATCNITLVDIAISFEAPLADGGALGPNDGVVAGSSLSLPICVDVSEPTATVTVTIDGGAPVATTNVGGSEFCTADVSLAEGSRTLVADATLGGRLGQASATVTVDLTGPAAPTDLTVSAANRAGVEINWTSPADALNYIGKFDTAPINDGNFDTAGTVFETPSPPSAPGATEFAELGELTPGTALFFAVASVDDVGNRSAPATFGPITPAIDRSGAISSIGNPPGIPADSTQRFGYNSVGADLNDDGFEDLVVAAQNAGSTGLVFVYLGSALGIESEPAFRINPTEPGSLFFGQGLAALDWNGDGTDDIAIGGPNQNGSRGVVSILFGGDTFTPGPDTIDLFQSRATDTDCGDGTEDCGARVQTDASATYPSFSFAGASLSRVRFNSDALDDLAIGIPGLASGGTSAVGGALVLFGGSTDRNIVVGATTVTGATGALLFLASGQPANSQFGWYVHNVGRIATASRDDLLIAPAEFATDADRVFVFRGRANPGSGQVLSPAFGGSDLQVVVGANTAPGRHAGSFRDLNGDNRREIALTAENRTPGTVYIVEGDRTGVQDASTVALLTITGTNFGRALANNSDVASADVDGDGTEDLVAASSDGASGSLLVWFGDTVVGGGATISSSSADLTLDAPASFENVWALDWVGDLDGDGFSDICWSDDQQTEDTSGIIEILR